MTPRRVLLAIVFLAATAAWVGLVFWMMAGLPPPAKKEPAYLDIDLAQVPAGSPRYFRFQGMPLAVVRTTGAMLDDLQAQTDYTWSRRPIAVPRPSFFVYSMLSPADGCEIDHVPKGADRYAPVRPWQGGYRDPCRFGEWDYAGRAIRQYPDQDPRLLQRDDLAVPEFEVRQERFVRITRAAKP